VLNKIDEGRIQRGVLSCRSNNIRRDTVTFPGKVTNWRDYDAALRNRGSLTVWFSEKALAG
jgi:hypothetical protein